jgi:large subunit ribosomal protein L28
MSMICDICGKHKAVGRSQKHKRGVAGKRWRKAVTATPRVFKPNLQKKTVIVSGEKQKMKLCAKCIKRIKKYKSIKTYKNIVLY